MSSALTIVVTCLLLLILLLFIFNCNWVDTRWQQYSTHLHTNSTQNTENGTYIIKKKIGKCGPCPVFASYTLAFALKLRKNHGNTSVRVVEKCPDIPVAEGQYTFTHKQCTEYRERNIHNNKKKKKGKCGPCPVFASYTLAFALQLRKKHGKPQLW
jgi:hypothetical protein